MSNLRKLFNIIFLSTESLRKKEIHWHKFVKKVLELPDRNHLTKVEGVGIYEGKTYKTQCSLGPIILLGKLDYKGG